MPIDLSNLSTIDTMGPTISYTPKFYSKKLTGIGGTNGVITHNTNPNDNIITANEINLYQETLLNDDYGNLMHYTENNVSKYKSIINNYYSLLPYNDLNVSNLQDQSQVKLSYADLVNDQLADWITLSDSRYRIRMFPSRLVLHEEKSTLSKVWHKQLIPSYHVQIVYAEKADYFTKYQTDDFDQLYSDTIMVNQNHQIEDVASKIECFNDLITNHHDMSFISFNVMDVKALFTLLGTKLMPQLVKDLNTFYKDYNFYESLCQVSKSFQTNSLHFLKIALKNDQFCSNNTYKHHLIYNLLGNISQLQLPLDQYQVIYKYLTKVLNNEPDTLNDIFNRNLNFRLNRLLTTLEKEKDQLVTIPKIATVDTKLSIEQQRAVKAPGPLTLVEAGAGTGKSSVLLSRIKYLLDGGVNPDDILILSFTNAAAQHIKDIYPDIKSLTINSMINNIYQNNFLSQMIVSSKTFYNTMLVKLDHSKYDPAFMEKFDKWCYDAVNSTYENNFSDLDREFQLLTELIQSNDNDIADICKTLGQTTFDIQIAMCYCQIDKLSLPKEIIAKHILVDEVQDNSTFDFMFLLRYILFEKASLFIVGDASQTLYAFRNANPYALNVLRTSSLFDIYQLQTNFRSRQEILDYANVLLNDIQANSFANIQLHSNSLVKPTLDTFKQNVQLIKISNNCINNLISALTNNTKLKQYITNCLSRNEKIAFLTYSHRELQVMQQVIQAMFGYKYNNSASFVDISSVKTNDSTILSTFWTTLDKTKKRQYANINRKNLFDTIKNDLINLHESDTYKKYAQKKWQALITDNKVFIDTLNNNYINLKINTKEYLQQLMTFMINYEVHHNHRMQQVVKNNNQMSIKQDKINQGTFIFSTIHSAKGLEFDNTVLLIREPEELTEADKRTYYVGLTRAKKSECAILAVYDQEHSLINYDYQIALNNLS